MAATGKLVAVTVAGILLNSATCVFPQDWTLTSAPITNWSSIAISADGSKLVAAVLGGPIYTSTNSGGTWTVAGAPVATWWSIASSAEGLKLVGTIRGGGIHTSTNAGVSWVLTGAPISDWQCVASSADGMSLFAAETNAAASYGLIYASTNAGATWNPTSSPRFPWLSIASSADGTKLAAVGHDYRTVLGQVYTSADAGASWSQSPPDQSWPAIGFSPDSVACSTDGRKLVLADLWSGVGTSQDWGNTWDVNLDLRGPTYRSVASSTDGDRLAAVADFTYSGSSAVIYRSTNSGVHWATNTVPALLWWRVASSSDGCRLVAAVIGGGIYTWQTTPRPVLNITPSDGNFVISWIVPSMPFVLQENADLNTTNWIDVPTQPILNLTNLHHEVSVPLSSTNRFYRLKSL